MEAPGANSRISRPPRPSGSGCVCVFFLSSKDESRGMFFFFRERAASILKHGDAILRAICFGGEDPLCSPPRFQVPVALGAMQGDKSTSLRDGQRILSFLSFDCK